MEVGREGGARAKPGNQLVMGNSVRSETTGLNFKTILFRHKWVCLKGKCV